MAANRLSSPDNISAYPWSKTPTNDAALDSSSLPTIKNRDDNEEVDADAAGDKADESGPWPLWRILDMLSCIPDEQVICVKKIQLIKGDVVIIVYER
mmetsp:Transcript_10852/g.9230  ORF Transcript_10852/g.9230 Transcript_10852/m.9230 type:complete len:97 (-) Transcript_10852:266-556(-)